MPLTIEGLPLDHTQSASRTTDSNGGPHRRVECLPNTQLQQLTSPTSLRTSPTKNSTSPRKANTHTLRADNNRRSLIDDDDDELIDYFDRAHDMKAFAAHADASPTQTSIQWNVQSNNIPTLPSFYPLEKSSVYIPDGTSPSVISSRISSVLTSRSITTSYNSSNAYVDCITSKGVEFRIRLYHDKDSTNDAIIVEVQRRKGFDISYMNDLYAILDGAEGKVDEVLSSDEMVEGISISIPPSCNEHGKSGEGEEDGERLASLRVISSILCPPPQQDQEGSVPQEKTVVTVEAQDIALSSLVSLTSIKSMGSATAQEISNELLTSDVYGDLRRVVFGNVTGELSSSQAQDPPQGEMIPSLQRSALQSLEILSNIATSLSPSKTHHLLVKLLSQSNGGILQKLILNIENASLNPRAASLSCIVLKNVWDTSFSEYKERVTMALQDAKSYGGEFYAELERHAQDCLDQLPL